MKGMNLIEFIQKNKLEFVKIELCWDDCLVFDFWLDEDHGHEIEYSWNYNGEHTIIEYQWDEDGNEIMCKDLTTEEALEIRTKYAVEVSKKGFYEYG